MPNWNENYIKLTGTKEKIAEAKALFESKDQEFDFNKIIPMPESEKENWYEWCTANWGTKWNAVDPSVEVNKTEIELCIHFRTAWCLPYEILTWMVTSDFLKGYDSFFWESSNEEDMYETYESYILDAEKGSVFRETGSYNEHGDSIDKKVGASFKIGEPIPMREEPNDGEISLEEVPF